MKVDIRHYEPTDLDAVLDTWEVATRLAHPFMSNEFIALERINVAEIYMPNTDTWVAELNGKVRGFVALMGNEVGAIFLDPELHGNGIGKALMDKAQSLHRSLELEVFVVNKRGRHFYEKYGFIQVAESMHEPTGQPVLRLKFTGDQHS